MRAVYRLLDRFFDPLPKEIREKGSKAEKVFYYESCDEGYKWGKRLYYRGLILQVLVTLGLCVLSFLIFILSK